MRLTPIVLLVLLAACNSQWTDAYRNCQTLQPGMTLDDVRRLCSTAEGVTVNTTRTAGGAQTQYLFDYSLDGRFLFNYSQDGSAQVYVYVDGSGHVTGVQY